MKVKRIVPVKILRPVDISEFNWQVWTDYQSGVFKFEIARKNFLTTEQVSSIIDGVMTTLRGKSSAVNSEHDFLSWESAKKFRKLIRDKFTKAPVINGNKIIMSEV
jgi:hypothetical protein